MPIFGISMFIFGLIYLIGGYNTPPISLNPVTFLRLSINSCVIGNPFFLGSKPKEI